MPFFTEIRYELDQDGELSEVGLPSQGQIRISTDMFNTNYDITAVAIHEIIHVLGFGLLWQGEDFIYSLGFDMNTPAPWNQHGEGDIINDHGNYVGTNALEAYSEYIGSPREYIPVEMGVGDGSMNGSNFVHWNYDELGWEMMSYNQEEGREKPLSKITIESLKDLGYDVIDFGDSNTQLVNYITTAIKQETDYVNEMLLSMQLNEDQINNNQIL